MGERSEPRGGRVTYSLIFYVLLVIHSTARKI